MPARAAYAVACAVLCTSPFAHGAAAGKALRANVDAVIKPVMAAYDIPGMAIAVTVNGTSSFFQYGVASRASGASVGPDTLFELGSVSKTFTATLATYAAEQGLLSLDDHPGAYLPQLRGSPLDQATLRDFGTYVAAGLPLQAPDDLADTAQALTWLQTWQPTAAPGKSRQYSNPSIGVLGLATAAAMHARFTDAEQALFAQLGLRHTYIDVPASAQANYAWGYNKANQPIRVTPGPFDAEAYGVKSTAADMLRFVEANIDPHRLPGPVGRAIEGTHAGHVAVGPMTQGLGWEQYAYPTTLARLLEGNAPEMALDPHSVEPIVRAPAVLFNKTGSTNGFGSYVLFIPAKKIGIVMLANRNYPNAARVEAAWKILGQLEAMNKMSFPLARKSATMAPLFGE